MPRAETDPPNPPIQTLLPKITFSGEEGFYIICPEQKLTLLAL
jgi:hypothetical protein